MSAQSAVIYVCQSVNQFFLKVFQGYFEDVSRCEKLRSSSGAALDNQDTAYYNTCSGRDRASNQGQGAQRYQFPSFQVQIPHGFPQKKGLFAFPMFQDKNQCQNICRAFGAVLPRKKGLVLSEFLLFQAFKINQLTFLIFRSKTHSFQP